MTLTHSFTAAAPVVCWTDLLSHRSALVRFAQRKLQDPALAEDVVHDVFEAVLSGRAVFAGRSLMRSWLTGILKNKIVDLIRQRAGCTSLDADCSDDSSKDAGDSASHSRAALVCPQPRPDEWAEQRQGLKRVLARIQELPAGLRDAITLRVLHDQPTEAVCQALDISEDNLFVRLHRARRQLATPLQ